ncbi:MAG: type VI secretion system-associated FHA domain protein TagH, partial [Sinobacteraceae bacterium]|nr:type VI secretion system-associated FHA domain protein TagH [Nevskiaceae bacterium]
MALLLKGISLNEEPMSRPLVGRFDERGGTLGRSDDATLTLPDPERLISRQQAQIVHRDNQYWIENISAASAVLHNGRPLSTGMRVILGDGDEIRIGGYALQASFENDADSATILRGRTVVPPTQNLPRVPPPAPLSQLEPGVTLNEPVRMPPVMEGALGKHGDPTVESLWSGFLQGAGIEPSTLPVSPSRSVLSSIGEMLKIAVGGLQRLIAMRARAKNEMQAEMTMIQPRDNNPLKFSPDEQLALQMLLQPPARGFLEGPAALRAAVTDLQSHQVGMTAGMRAVLEAVLERLAPAKLESLQEKGSALDFLQPARKRAQLWEAYLREYQSLREEAQDNFQRFFGEVFRDAYEAQVRNLDTSGETTGLRARTAET